MATTESAQPVVGRPTELGRYTIAEGDKRQAERLGDCPMRASLINLDESDRIREALS